MTFDLFSMQPEDPLLSLANLARSDDRSHRMDLSVGVYRDATGRTPILAAVKEAERRLVAGQVTKAYLGPGGDDVFIERLRPIVFGSSLAQRHVVGLQTTGGTGALYLAAKLLAKHPGGRRIWLGQPTWPNHHAVLASAGLTVVPFEPFDVATQRLLPEAILAALEVAGRGDAVLLQPFCQNPTGVDPDPALWSQMVAIIAARGLIPLVDVAYQGFGAGLEADAAPLRILVKSVPDALIAYSCNKNFGLYRDRVGALFFTSNVATRADIVRSHLLGLARASYSMPPDHGAAVVRTILEDPALILDWRNALDTMRRQITSVRLALAAHGVIGRIDLSPLAIQAGMFSTLPLPVMAVRALRMRHAIYMAESGRLNLAGLALAQIPLFLQALEDVQIRRAA